MRGKAFTRIALIVLCLLVSAAARAQGTILSEGFEGSSLDPRITVSSVGGVSWGVKPTTVFGSSRAFGFGSSSCWQYCWSNYTSDTRHHLSAARVRDVSVVQGDRVGPERRQRRCRPHRLHTARCRRNGVLRDVWEASLQRPRHGHDLPHPRSRHRQGRQQARDSVVGCVWSQRDLPRRPDHRGPSCHLVGCQVLRASPTSTDLSGNEHTVTGGRIHADSPALTTDSAVPVGRWHGHHRRCHGRE